MVELLQHIVKDTIAFIDYNMVVVIPYYGSNYQDSIVRYNFDLIYMVECSLIDYSFDLTLSSCLNIPFVTGVQKYG